MSNRKHAEFQGTERFLIKQCIGSGSFGVVYKAYDQERNAIVALKTLHQADAEGLYRFKQEFRFLADIIHPNLVTLYELMSDKEQWFFTMELVEGVDFLDYVRVANQQQHISLGELETVDVPQKHAIDTVEEKETLIKSTSPSGLAAKSTTPSELAKSTSPSEIDTVKFSSINNPSYDKPVAPIISAKPQFKCDLTRLRDVLKQLASGIYALHKAGKLHRDIKPSNVLVNKDGRVVILDFGIATELAFELALQEQQKGIDIVGTPAYMSPEQSAALPVSEATDWYSVGVMLYEALTNKRPFTGEVMEILLLKQRFEPLAPSKLVKDIPPDLDTLCQQLLKRDPKERPSGLEILQSLNITGINQQEPKLAVMSSRTIPFVGRDDYLAILMEAFNIIKHKKHTSTVYIQGRSGMGKSALARHFLEQLRQNKENIVVLAGRCYEQESVPYKAFDSLIDALSQYLKQLFEVEIEKLLTPDVLALVRLFPVLKQVPALAKAESKVLEIPDTQELRRRAFNALREMLARLAKEKLLILFIDDLQWGDLDSVSLLSELLRPPDSPPFLLITTYRSEDITTSPFLKAFLPLRANLMIEVKEIALKELSQQESHQLAIALLGKEDEELLARATRIAQESKGSPFFVDELVRYTQLSETSTLQTIDSISNITSSNPANPSTSINNANLLTKQTNKTNSLSQEDSGITRLDQVIQARVMSMPQDAQRLLEIVAVAGQPLERAIAKQAANLDTQEQASFALLRANRMIRVTSTSQQEQIETYHDRIRETVVANLSSEALKTHHNQLALLLESTNQADAERLATHFYKAGNNKQAAKYAIDAAAKAYNALAFDRAARFYQFALELGNQEDSETHSLQVKLADSLTNAGQSYDAAKIYLIAAKTAKDLEVLELRQRAADQFLRSGYVKEAFAELRIITDKVGIKIAETPLRALLSFLLQRIKIWLRGLDFQEHAASEVAVEDLLRLDTFWSVSSGLSLIDATRGIELQAQHLLFALKIGEPQRVARALAAETAYTASAGGRKAKRTKELLATTKALAERIQHPYTTAITASVCGITAGCFGEWKRCVEEFARAEIIFRQNCTGVSSELDTGNYWTSTSLYFMGNFTELFNRLPKMLKDIRERGNLFSETNLRLRTTYIRFLANDEVNNAKEELNQTIKRWSQSGFQMQHFWHLFGQMQTLLYAGEAHAAWQLITEKWPIVTKSFLLRIQSFYIQALHVRARSALALMAQSSSHTSLLKNIKHYAQLIEKENMPWGNAFALQIRANIALIEGEKQKAITLLTKAEENFDTVDMALYSTVLRRRRGELIGGDQGKTLVDNANIWMNNQQIKNPSAMADMLAPGKWIG